MSEDYSTIYRKRGASYEKGRKFQWLTPVPAVRHTGVKTVRWPQPRTHKHKFSSDFEKTFVLCPQEEKYCHERWKIYTSQKKCTQMSFHFMDSVRGMQGKLSKSAHV